MKTILLHKGKEAIVDDSDFDELNKYKWYGNGNSDGTIIYAKRRTKKSDNRKEKLITMHRQIMDYPSLCVDHINHNGLDNRRSNLRICTISENTKNRRKSKNNSSGYKGVSYYPRIKKWRALIRTTIGYYNTKEEAMREYDRISKLIHGDYACQNFSDERRDVT